MIRLLLFGLLCAAIGIAGMAAIAPEPVDAEASFYYGAWRGCIATLSVMVNSGIVWITFDQAQEWCDKLIEIARDEDAYNEPLLNAGIDA